jgi:hypothetical protein
VSVPRANWFLEELPIEESLELGEQAKIEELGKPIHLRAEPALNEQLIALVNQEGQLHDRGVTCAIKDRDDTTCLACPVRAESVAERLHPLCQVGVQQERVATELAVLRVNGESPAS